MSSPIHWAILGTGRIARTFASQLPSTTGGKLIAIGSRTPASAPPWCDAAIMSYAAAVQHPDVHAVYIALPNGLHKEWTVRAIHAGKHVLCEKPLSCSEADVTEMFDHARTRSRLLAEAFMYRCQPAVQHALHMIQEGVIGEIRTMRGAFSFEQELHPHDPRWDAGMGGGALWDVGCYPVQFMNAVMDAEPSRVTAVLHDRRPGVDGSGAALLDYGSGVAGIITFGMEIGGDRSFVVCGTRGKIKFEDPWLNGSEFTWTHDRGTETIRMPAEAGLYALEADAFALAMRGEKLPWISEEESLRSVRTLSRIRGAVVDE